MLQPRIGIRGKSSAAQITSCLKYMTSQGDTPLLIDCYNEMVGYRWAIFFFTSRYAKLLFADILCLGPLRELHPWSTGPWGFHHCCYRQQATRVGIAVFHVGQEDGAPSMLQRKKGVQRMDM